MQRKQLPLIGFMLGFMLVSGCIGQEDRCPEGLVLDDTYEVCCPEGSQYDPETDQCLAPCPEGYYLKDGQCVSEEVSPPPPPPVSCPEGEYLGADGQCHPEDTPMITQPDPTTDECPEGYYPCYMTDCCKIPEEGATRLPGLSLTDTTVGGVPAWVWLVLLGVGAVWLWQKTQK